MRNFLFVFCLGCLAQFAFAQAPLIPRYEYMQVTTIESLVPGGAGRSRMLVTDRSGNAQELPMSNVFSFGGINFGNIKDNDKSITVKMNELSEQGWELTATTTAANESLFITRYLLKKPK